MVFNKIEFVVFLFFKSKLLKQVKFGKIKGYNCELY